MTDDGTDANIPLFTRIGGELGILAMVDRFYDRVLADTELAHFFSHVAMDTLRKMQLEFFSAALGGPVQYTGRPIVHAHQTHRINLADFQRFTRHLFDTLESFSINEQDRYDIVSRLNVYIDDVVSAGTGIVG